MIRFNLGKPYTSKFDTFVLIWNIAPECVLCSLESGLSSLWHQEPLAVLQHALLLKLQDIILCIGLGNNSSMVQ